MSMVVRVPGKNHGMSAKFLTLHRASEHIRKIKEGQFKGGTMSGIHEDLGYIPNTSKNFKLAGCVGEYF